MSQLEEIKHRFHDLIDQVDDEKALSHYFEIVTSEIKGDATDFWDDIIPEEQTEILEAYEDSKDPKNWITHEEVKHKYEKWLSK